MIINQKKEINFVPENFDSKNFDRIYLAIKNDEFLINSKTGQLAILNHDEYQWSGMDSSEPIFVGYLNNNSLYVLSLNSSSVLIPETTLKPFRALLGMLSDAYFGICSRSIQLVSWSRRSKYCGSCGKKTSIHLSEKAMYCKDCNNLIYPRISPCVIVLVTDKDKLLLAHNKNFPNQIYSTLAGFIEVGETAEEAISREIYEEVEIKVKNIEYFGSQSWPFPSQLMLGFYAEYDTGVINPDGEEIDKADWFHYRSLPEVPPAKISISGSLIQNFINKLEKGNF